MSVLRACCVESSESEPMLCRVRECGFTGDGFGDTNRPGDEWRDRMRGEGEAEGLAVFAVVVRALRAGFRTGAVSSSPLLIADARSCTSIWASCCVGCVSLAFSAASRFLMRWYAASASLSSAASGESILGCGRDSGSGLAGMGVSSSDSDVLLSDSALLSEESCMVDFRSAPNSVFRGLEGMAAFCEVAEVVDSISKSIGCVYAADGCAVAFRLTGRCRVALSGSRK